LTSILGCGPVIPPVHPAPVYIYWNLHAAFITGTPLERYACNTKIESLHIWLLVACSFPQHCTST
jgi:hypothetical protein